METDEQRRAREAAEAAERARKQRIRNQINDLNTTRSKYTDARDKVRTAKADVGSVRSSWGTSVDSITSTDIVKKGSFEGEMANQLKSKVESSVDENSKYLADADNLVSELETQINKINTRISQIDQQIANLRAQL